MSTLYKLRGACFEVSRGVSKSILTFGLTCHTRLKKHRVTASMVRAALRVVSDKRNAPRSLKGNTRKTSGTCVSARLCHLLRTRTSVSLFHQLPDDAGRLLAGLQAPRLRGCRERAQRRQAQAAAHGASGSPDPFPAGSCVSVGPASCPVLSWSQSAPGPVRPRCPKDRLTSLPRGPGQRAQAWAAVWPSVPGSRRTESSMCS